MDARADINRIVTYCAAGKKRIRVRPLVARLPVHKIRGFLMAGCGTQSTPSAEPIPARRETPGFFARVQPPDTHRLLGQPGGRQRPEDIDGAQLKHIVIGESVGGPMR